MNRRSFLRAAALLPWTLGPAANALAAAARVTTTAGSGPPPAPPGYPAVGMLHAAMQTEARQAKDPWSICHGMLGAGTGLRLESGEIAVDYLLKNFLKKDEDGGPYFEVTGSGTLLGEQHPYLVLKKLVELKLHPELWKPLTDTGLKTLRMPETQAQWDDITWLLWATAQQPQYTAATTVGPKKVRLGDVAQAALARLELADKPVEAALAAKGVANFERPSSSDPAAKDSVWGFTCGGQHFLQTVMACQWHGLLPPATLPRIEARLATFQKRLAGESNFRLAEKKKALAAGVEAAMAEHQTALALLKLNGHALETLGRARDAGFGKKPELNSTAHAAADRLEQSQLGFQMRVQLAPYLASIRTKSAANWRNWLGDGCHALHGFSYWPGPGGARG